ncbi:MAG: hypothetical protein QOF09_1854 [Alphaproteobacteria bacterium]|jgi:hypothetical protein|nr:hypothetical protein [Alphaproteobacteria bacterium]
MRVVTNTTWFFSVVGASTIAERHAEGDIRRRGSQRISYQATLPGPTGSWLNDDR